MAAANSDTPTSLTENEVWHDFTPGNEEILEGSQPQEYVTAATNISPNENSDEVDVIEHLEYVGRDWSSAQDLFHHTSDYIKNKEDEFNQYHHLNGGELLAELRDKARGIDRLLNDTLENLNSFKEKAEYKAVKTLRKYDDLEQTISKMQAGKHEGQRVVEDQVYEQIVDMKENLGDCLEDHIFNLEMEHNLEITGQMESYEVNVSPYNR